MSIRPSSSDLRVELTYFILRVSSDLSKSREVKFKNGSLTLALLATKTAWELYD